MPKRPARWNRRWVARRLAVVAASASLFGAVVAAPASASTPVVVALWHLDESPGATQMVDSSGSAVQHDGAISPDVVLGVPGAQGTAYGFRGGSPIVRVPSAADLNPGLQPLTISARLNVPANLAGGDYNVLQKGPANTVGGAYKLEIFGKAGSRLFGYPACAFNSPGGLKNRVYGPTRINDGRWHHVECHLTATQAYVTVDEVDGPQKPRAVGSIANNVDVTLGGKPNSTHFYSGDLDEVSITIG